MNLKSNTKWNSRDLQNNLLIIPYTIVPPVSYLQACIKEREFYVAL